MIKDANKKNIKKRKRKGGYVPIARANSQFISISAVVGVKRSCLPDAVAMLTAEEGIDVSVAEAYAAMPFTREDPTVCQADTFLQTFDMELQPQSDLNSNALQLFMRKDGNYLLETELEIDGEKETHFAVYCSKRAWKKYSKRGVGVLIDNSDNDFVGVEEKDRIDKQGAIRAFEGKWVGIKSAHLITVYRLVHKPAPPVTDAKSSSSEATATINGVVLSDAKVIAQLDGEYTVIINGVEYTTDAKVAAGAAASRAESASLERLFDRLWSQGVRRALARHSDTLMIAQNL